MSDTETTENKKRIRCSGKRPPKYYDFNFDEKFKDIEWDDVAEKLVTVLKEEHNLKLGDELVHGDVINTSDYRYSNCFLVVARPRKEETTSEEEPAMDAEELVFIRNPDLSAAGYLTIPLEVSKGFESSINTYMQAEWSADIPLITIEADSSDTYITSRIGDLPKEWRIEVNLVESAIDEIFLSLEDDVRCFTPKDFEKLSVETLLKPQAKFDFICKLDDDALNAHCEKIGLEAAKYYKVPSTRPDVPEGWRIEPGSSGMINKVYKFTWKFSGPKSSEEEVRKIVREFVPEEADVEFE